MVGVAEVPDEERTGNEEQPLMKRRFSGLDGKELSEMMCLSHKQSFDHWLKLREKNRDAVMSTIATIPQIRMTRKIAGEYELTHAQMHTFFDDSIGMVSNWKKRGPIYEVPFRTLYNRNMKNLIVAGRNNKGLVTMDRATKKDSYYIYKAYWNPAPMVHLCGKRYASAPVRPEKSRSTPTRRPWSCT